MSMEQIKDIFMKNVEQIPFHDCWEWLGNIDTYGYGRIYFNGKMTKAHRLSYIIFKNEIPKNLWVLHKCDNRSCVNPDHLFLGTSAENIADMVKKGRQAKGEKHRQALRGLRVGIKNPAAKLSEDQIVHIRELYEIGHTQKALAQSFKVVRSTIGRVVRKTHWKHL
jgi:HNH endonuclease